ncbi:MAG: hypothetical protein HMLKMBBP_03523 [Planctomycetes bacterium]|nr:hypothetical protein [Planctomycetota bacterium]
MNAPRGAASTLVVDCAIVAITAAWGLSFVVIDDGERAAGTFGLTAFRMTTAVVTALVLLRPDLRSLAADRRTLRLALGGGCLLAAGFLLQTWGLRTTDAGVAGFLTSLSVPLVPLFQAVVDRRAPRAGEAAMLVVASAGIVMIASPDRAVGFGVGEICGAASAFCWAAQIVLVGRIASKADPAALSVAQLAVVAAVGWTGRAFSSEGPVAWTASLWGIVFFLGYVTCALGFAVQAWAQRTHSPTRVAILFALEPLFASLAGWWIEDERFVPRKLLGCGLVAVAVAGSIWASWRSERAAARAPGDAGAQPKD